MTPTLDTPRLRRDRSSGFGPEQGVGIGTICLGSLGAIAGLIQGLRVHPATAWFAVFELGLPAALAGAVIGAIIGLAARMIVWLKSRRININ
jgi:hypothetical protein